MKIYLLHQIKSSIIGYSKTCLKYKGAVVLVTQFYVEPRLAQQLHTHTHWDNVDAVNVLLIVSLLYDHQASIIGLLRN